MEQAGPSSRLRVPALLLGCLLYCAASYFLLEWFLGIRGDASVTFTFLIAVPAALASFLSYLSDRDATRGVGFHAGIAIVPLIIGIVGGLLLGEGLICILMLLPIWSLTALVAATITYFLRRAHDREDGLRSSAILLAPLLVAQIEAASPVPVSTEIVRRAVVIHAPPDRVWPLLVAIPDVRPDEGRWNVTQDLLRVPRPSHALLTVRGGKPVRVAHWGPHIRFEEHIIRWDKNRELRWNFVFPDESVREHIDRHIAPNGHHLTISHGGYRLTPLADGRTELALETAYELRSPVNSYASWWGNWMLGDIQDNVLRIVKNRAEASGGVKAS